MHVFNWTQFSIVKDLLIYQSVQLRTSICTLNNILPIEYALWFLVPFWPHAVQTTATLGMFD